MTGIVVGGAIALIGVVIGGIINGWFSLWSTRVARCEQEAKDRKTAKESAYVEFVCFFNCILQMIHPSVGEDTPGKYMAGMQLGQFVDRLCRNLSKVQIYGSQSVMEEVLRLVHRYNEYATDANRDAEVAIQELNEIMRCLVEKIRMEISVPANSRLSLGMIVK